ncbi:MAG TPA: hypothetical protein VFV23_05310 [Verrucomicrobiae bacterium]|nr:hypothetical protein [Verrucomicrobiae bacterium]
MEPSDFNDSQKRALLDLLVLGMYADGNLDLIEDEKAQRILDSISFASDTERQQFLDGSFTRARQYNISPASQRGYVSQIAKQFPTPALRRKVYNALEDSLSSDNKIADKERELLILVTEEFNL